jgi:hypothetical protein
VSTALPDLTDIPGFGAYEVLSYLIPGSLIIVAGILSIGHLAPALAEEVSLPTSFSLILLLFFSFTTGVALQYTSGPLENWILRRHNRRFGSTRDGNGFPSAVMLDKDNHFLDDEVKEGIRRQAVSKLGASLNDSSQKIFNLCYAYINDKGIGQRARQFQNMYSFCRNTMSALIIDSALVLAWAVSPWRDSSVPLVVLAGASFLISFVFARMFLKYTENFAEEVFTSFYARATTA